MEVNNLTKEQKTILNALLDKYERSATFRGDNAVKQSFTVKPEELFSHYRDDADYDCFVSVNDAVCALAGYGFIGCDQRNSVVLKISLKTEKLPEVYKALGRIPKDRTINEMRIFLEEQKQILRVDDAGGIYKEELSENDSDDVKSALLQYISNQEERLQVAKLPEYYENLKDYSDLWILLRFLSKEHGEVFVRDLSVKLYRDSKRLEAIAGKAESLLYKYGSFPEREKVLEECSVLKTPSYVMCKGSMILRLDKQELDLGKLSGDLAFSGKTLSEISEIVVTAKRLVTVENLTTFHRYEGGPEEAVVYLGGFHNTVKRDFLKRIYRNNKNLSFFHFGDIDAGGFYIFEHLRRKTGIPFRPMNMGIPELQKYKDYTKPLSVSDVARLNKLIEKYSGVLESTDEADKEIADQTIKTLKYMLENNVKLEQEALE